MILLWATRGRSWGFRFLPLEGTTRTDPLTVYERAFAGHGDETEGCWRTGGLLAVRFEDPEGRTDESGRMIPHELVLDAATTEVASLTEAIARIWPLLAERYDAIWDGPAPER